MVFKKIIFIIIIFFSVAALGVIVISGLYQPNFTRLSPQEMYKTVISDRDYAINQAVLAGKYHCCIQPPCTMCYMEANKWNNYIPGTCNCDNFIARGEKPCPQCQAGEVGMANSDQNHCDLNSVQPVCDAVKNKK